MTHPVYRAERTGLLLFDPYNDFLSHGGKLFPLLKEVADEVHLLDNLRATVAAARAADVQVFSTHKIIAVSQSTQDPVV